MPASSTWSDCCAEILAVWCHVRPLDFRPHFALLTSIVRYSTATSAVDVDTHVHLAVKSDLKMLCMGGRRRRRKGTQQNGLFIVAAVLLLGHSPSSCAAEEVGDVVRSYDCNTASVVDTHVHAAVCCRVTFNAVDRRMAATSSRNTASCL